MSRVDEVHPIIPDWPAPGRVRAASSTRTGGTSAGPWGTLNLADHVADEREAVARNRARLRDELGLPQEPRWLSQRHGARVVDTDAPNERGSGRRERRA